MNEELVLRRQALPPEQSVRPPTAEELAGLRAGASYGRPWRQATLGPWSDPRRSDRLMIQAPYQGGQAVARRTDDSWVRGVVWAACEQLEERGLFEHTRGLEQDVEATFQLTRLVPPVKVGSGVFDAAALADAHADRTAGEQLGLTL